MHWDRTNLSERNDVYCAPVPTETTEKFQTILALLDGLQELHIDGYKPE